VWLEFPGHLQSLKSRRTDGGGSIGLPLGVVWVLLDWAFDKLWKESI
jgi:hypothetical protein